MPISMALALGACGGGGSGGGGGTTSGAGLQLRGTVPDNRRLASRQLEIRAASGERSVATIEADGRFGVESLAGTGPWMMRATFGVDESWYAIAHAAGAVTNVHAYSDLAIRNVAATAGKSVETLFDQEGALSSGELPAATEIGAVNTVIGDFLAPSFEAYGLAGTDLSSVEFAADGGGIDAFLSSNPALVENDAFTILATDPATQIRTTIADAVPIAQDLLAADGTAPGTPPNFRALPAASNEIVLVWDAARDDIAVARYEVRRDAVLVETTPYPVFRDIPLEPGVEHDYEVIAIDAAGNRSIATPTVSAEPLAEPDVEAPPAPTALEVTLANASARLRWSQASIGDVASFELYRSEDGGMIAERARVTSTGTTDLDLSVATPYCYAVRALDAAENPSEFSAQVCASTTGSTDVRPPTVTPVTPGTPTTPTTPTTPVTPGQPAAPGPADARLDALLAVDVTNIACDVELDTASIEGAMVLDRPCYQVPAGLVVRENGQLTIAAGTVLKFGSSRGLQVLTGGSLTAVGTPDAPIVFSGLDPTPGFWRSVEFSHSNSTRNVLENVVIEYAGGADRAALDIRSQTSRIGRVAVDGAVLRRNAGVGFRIDSDTFRGSLENIVSTQNAAPGTIGAENAALLGSGGRYSGNALDEIRIGSTTLSAASVWPSVDVAWSMGTLQVRAPLEIPAGTTVRFDAGGGLAVDASGSLRAIGTAAAPTLFTGTDPTPGFWDGLAFVLSNSVDNRLEHVTVEYAGGLGTNDGGIVARSFDSSPTRLELRDVTTRFNEGPGFRIQRGSRIGAFERVISTGNALAGVVFPEVLSAFGGGLSLRGNTDDVVSLDDADIASAVTWPALDVPYTFGVLNVTGALTIAPGTGLLARANASITVTETGSLVAVGTASAPISITGQDRIVGRWRGIDLRFSNSPGNRLEHVELRHGGGGGASATRGNLTMSCFTSSPARVSIADSIIADSAGWGIYRRPDSACTVNLGPRVTFSGNGEGDVSP